MALDNLRLGRDVAGDSINPWMLTRNAWKEVGLTASAQVLEVDIVCTDLVQHRSRIETWTIDVTGLIRPDPA